MTAPFVTGLRTGSEVIRLDGAGVPGLNLRVQAAELWDAVRVAAPGTASLAAVKAAALDAFFPDGVGHAEFVAKLRGFEILHEQDTLEASGVRDGSTILLERRKRRPVR